MGQFRSLIGVTPYERDPKVALPLSFVQAEGLNIARSSALEDSATGGNFWPWVASRGSYQTSSPATATRTILNVTGRGQLKGVIGPCITSTAGSTTFTITVDGTAFTIIAELTHGQAINQRAVLGDCLRAAVQNTTANISGGYGTVGLLARDATNIATTFYTDEMVLRSPVEISRFVKFDTSLRIDVACSTLAASGNDAYAGALWHLDA